MKTNTYVFVEGEAHATEDGDWCRAEDVAALERELTENIVTLETRVLTLVDDNNALRRERDNLNEVVSQRERSLAEMESELSRANVANTLHKCGCRGLFHSSSCSDQDALDPLGSIVDPQHRDALRQLIKDRGWTQAPEMASREASGVFIRREFSDLFYETDGPPYAYFEIPLPLGAQTKDNGGPFYLRGEYESLVIYADNEQAARSELRRLLTMAANLLPADEQDPLAQFPPERRTRFLIWRRRPTWERRYPTKSGRGALYSRFWISGFSLSQIPLDRNNARQFVVWNV